MENIEETLWSFVRGDMSDERFEMFVYAAQGLEEFLGTKTYIEVLSNRYGDKNKTRDLKDMLRQWLEEHKKTTCGCITWKTNQIIPLLYDNRPDVFFLTFNVLKQRNPWLDLVRCKECGQWWYVATDTVDDDYRMLRLTEEQAQDILQNDKWPVVFDDYENVWPDTTHKSHV